MAAFTVIDHTELGAAASSWEVTGISSSYDHLYLEVSTRSDETAGWTVYLSDVRLQVSSDTGSNYSSTNIYWYNASTPLSDRGGATYLDRMKCAATGTLADTFTPMTMWIPNYANTTGFKQIVGQQSVENNSTTDYRYYMGLNAFLWQSTAAVTALKLYPSTSDFVQYSTFTLYGVTGA